mgnify:CR=1 FL=1
MLDRRSGTNDYIRASFNITMMDLKCDYVEIDVVSVLGNKQNVTKSVKKVSLSSDGVMQTMVRNIKELNKTGLLELDSEGRK